MPTEIAVVRIEKVVTSQKIIKKGLKENITNFLQTPNKLSNKKRRQINQSNWKASLEKTSFKKAIISSLDSLEKKELPIPILVTVKLNRKAKDIDIAIIGTDTYRAACRLKGAQVFAISMRNIQYQTEKEARAETNSKSVVLQEYHDFLDVFSKKDLDTLPLY